MVWFDKPVLCTEGNVRLVVKKHLQRGEQPDGLVRDPWRELEDFPEDEDIAL
jgi:3-aminobutyryl-CoA ammonia-lyase